MFVWPMCDLLDVTVDGWNMEQYLLIYLFYVAPDFSYIGSTTPRGGIAAIGTAFCSH